MNEITEENGKLLQRVIHALFDEHDNGYETLNFSNLDEWKNWTKCEENHDSVHCHWLGYEKKSIDSTPHLLIYIRPAPFSNSTFKLPIIDSQMSLDQLVKLTNAFLKSIPKLTEKFDVSDLIKTQKISNSPRLNEICKKAIEDTNRPYENRLSRYSLLCEQFNNILRKEIIDPKWDTMGVGFFGKKTPVTISKLRTLLHERTANPRELLDMAEALIDSSLKRKPRYRAKEVLFLYEKMQLKITDFKNQYQIDNNKMGEQPVLPIQRL